MSVPELGLALVIERQVYAVPDGRPRVDNDWVANNASESRTSRCVETLMRVSTVIAPKWNCRAGLMVQGRVVIVADE